MDLRVYVDGVVRIICDLTRTTTVHDVIIALAQYKGKTGRYSLIERAPDGTYRTLSPNEFTHELNHRPDWSYILRENLSNSDLSDNQKRSKSLDGRKTPIQQQSTIETPTTVISSTSSSSSTTANSTSGHFRTVNHNNNNGLTTLSSSSSSSTKSSEKKKRSHLRHAFPSANVNNNNNNHLNSNEYPSPISFIMEQKRSSRAPAQIIEQDFGVLDNRSSNRRGRPKSTVPLPTNENSAFRIVHNPTHSSIDIKQQQQQYIALLKILKSQELQVEEQEKELLEKQLEIDYREKIIYQKNIENQYNLIKEQELRLDTESQLYSEEIPTSELDKELEHEKKLHSTYEHLQQQLNRCSVALEQKRQLQEQIQLNVEKTHEDIEQIQSTINNDKKDISQYQHELERSNTIINKQEDLARVLIQRTEDIDRVIQQRRQQISELESELNKLDESVINSFIHSSYNFRSNSSPPQHYNSLPSTSTTTDAFMPVRLQLVNRTLWKLCPSGIWV